MQASNMLELTSSFRYLYILRGHSRMTNGRIVHPSFTTSTDKSLVENTKSFNYCSYYLNRFQRLVENGTMRLLVPLEVLYLH